jgi:SAM-dependent methyltransferase
MNLSYTPDLNGIYRPSAPVTHRNEEYDQSGFDMLFQMQAKHFWYRGRHRFLLSAVDRCMRLQQSPFSAVDLGGGVGGWVRYLADRRADRFQTFALADSSEKALRLAKNTLPASAQRYQIDLMNLGWKDQWDCAFLLDVIEHLHDDTEAVCQAAKALKPGGYLFVTTPALKQFWSYNDELASHLRRYNRNDYCDLAARTGLELCDARYFMFFLSPLYLLSRIKLGIAKMSDDEKKALVLKQHAIPAKPINTLLTAIFCAETPLGHWMRFLWGTSILGVFKKP